MGKIPFHALLVQKAMEQRVKLGHGTPPSSYKYVRDMKQMIWYAVQSMSEPFYSSYKNFGANYHKEIEIKANFFGYYDKQFKFRVNCQSAFVNRLIEGYQEAKHLKKNVDSVEPPRGTLPWNTSLAPHFPLITDSADTSRGYPPWNTSRGTPRGAQWNTPRGTLFCSIKF